MGKLTESVAFPLDDLLAEWGYDQNPPTTIYIKDGVLYLDWMQEDE